jgi:replicative DNA helicase
MLGPAALDAVSELLRPADFYRQSHGIIYSAALDLHGRGVPVDAITLADHLDELGKLGDGGAQIPKVRIHELAALVPAASNVAHYAGVVKEMAQLRDLIYAGGEIARLGWERPGDVENLNDRAQQLVFELGSRSDRRTLEPIGGHLNATFDRISQLYENGSDVVGVPSGFRELDRITLGFEPGDMIVPAARPSMGKSSLALAIAAHVAFRQGLPVAVFSLEMVKQVLTQRLLAREAHVDLKGIRTGKLDEAEWGRLAAAGNLIEKAPFLADDTRGLTLMDMRSKLRRAKARYPNLALVVVDYLQLIHVPGVKPDNHTAITTIVSQGLKTLAGDFEVPIMALSQLNRAVELRADKRPMLADLRQSGAIEQDADIVMFLYRDGYYNDESLTPDLTEINVAKNRNGATGKAELYFKERWATFTEVDT